MKTLNLIIAVIALGFAGSTIANPQSQSQYAPQQQQQQPSVEVSDAKLEKFTEIYVDVETTRSEMAKELEAVADREKAQKIQARMSDEIIATIEDHGWTLEEYNEVAQAISMDDQLREEAIKLINESTGA